VVSFLVDGEPIPQGSKVAKLIPAPGTKWGVRPVLYDDNDKALKPWRKAVTAAAKAAAVDLDQLVDVPIVVVVEFRMSRPKTVKREYPTVKPDVDKLERAVLDAVTDAGVWNDDSRVVVLKGSMVYAKTAGAFVQVGVIEKEGMEQ